MAIDFSKVTKIIGPGGKEVTKITRTSDNVVLWQSGASGTLSSNWWWNTNHSPNTYACYTTDIIQAACKSGYSKFRISVEAQTVKNTQNKNNPISSMVNLLFGYEYTRTGTSSIFIMNYQDKIFENATATLGDDGYYTMTIKSCQSGNWISLSSAAQQFYGFAAAQRVSDTTSSYNYMTGMITSWLNLIKVRYEFSK